MRNIKSETKVGIFVIIGLVILVWGTTQVGNFKFGKPKGRMVTAVFNSVAGLDEKSPVRIAGVRVGEVEKIYLKDGLAYVQIRLQPEATVREDSEVAIASSGLLGEKYLEMTSGTIGKPEVGPGAVLPGKDIVSMDKLIAQLTDVAGDIKVMTASLRGFFGPEGGHAPLRDLTEHFDQMVINIDKLIGENRAEISRAVKGVGDFAEQARGTIGDNRQDIRTAITNFKSLSEDLRNQTKELSDKLAKVVESVDSSVKGVRGDFGNAVGDVRKTAASIDDTLATVKRLLAEVEQGKGTVGKMVKDGSVYDNLNKTLTSVGDVSGKISRGEGTLGKLVTDDAMYKSLNETMAAVQKWVKRSDDMKLHLGYRGEYIFDENDVKSYFSMRLNPRPDKFYMVELIDDPLGRRSLTETTTTVKAGGGENVIRVTEEKVEDKFTFSILYGQRFNDFVLRGGLMEATGGAGADYLFLRDRGRVSLDAWDFDRPHGNPHFKLSGAWNVTNTFYLSGGLDDFVDSSRRSLFVGGGFQFADEDLKYTLPILSGLPVGK